MPLFLAITADDLGIGSERDRGIFAAFEAGGVTQASLLVNGPSASAAARRARALGLPLGLHLNLTEGAALSGSSSLTDASAEMRGKHGFRAAIAAGEIESSAIEGEILAQLERFTELTESPPDCIDGHQHVHVLEPVSILLARAAKAAGAVCVRMPGPGGNEAPTHAFYAQVCADARASEATFSAQGLVTTHHFMGLELMGRRLEARRVLEQLERLARDSADAEEARSVELMTHPGFPGTDWDDFNRSPDRRHELEVLRATSFRAALGEHVTLDSMAGLAARGVCR